MCSALENDRRVSQNRPRQFYRVSILSCASIWEVYHTFYRASILSPPSVRELYALSTGCSFYIVPQFGKYIERTFYRVFILSCPSVWEVYRSNFLQDVHFISLLSLGSISHFLQGVHFISSLSYGSISHILQGVHFICPSVRERYSTFYSMSSLSRPSVREVFRIFYRMSILSRPSGKCIALSTGCPFYLVPQGGISHLLQGVYFILSLNLGSISHRKPLSGSHLVALRDSSTTQGTLNYRGKTLL